MLMGNDEPTATADDIRRYLQRLLARYLNVSVKQLNDEESFFSLGLTSLIHAEVLGCLNAVFGQLSSTVMFEYPNLSLLTEHLALRRTDRDLLIAAENEN